MTNAWLSEQRQTFHRDCLSGSITTTDGLPSIADKGNKPSREISIALIDKLPPPKEVTEKPAGQTSGHLFEIACQSFIEKSLAQLSHLRPGDFKVERSRTLSDFDQYSHLDEIRVLTENSKELKTHLGTDYLIKPDVVVFREPESDETINSDVTLVDGTVATQTPLRRANGPHATLHASVSCKLTIRSDRVQNTRSEALNLIRNRKGRLPHTVAITAEPTPTRIAAIALGTGDIDCVYHFALIELVEVLKEQQRETLELVETMVNGKRLRDIADLPLDLVI